MPINVNAMTEQQQITAIYVAYYDRAPDPAGLQYWVDQLQGGRSLAQIASDFSEAAETKAKYPYFDAPDVASADTFITGIYTNLFGRTPDDAGREFWSGQLESGSTPVGEIILAILEGAQSAADGGFPDEATVNNKIEVGLDWAQSAIEAGIGLSSNPIAEEVDGEVVVNNNEAFDSATGVLDNVDGTADSVTDAKAETDTFVAGGGGSGDTFMLTTGADDLTGTANNDTFNALSINAEGAAASTLTGFDSIDGGSGTDTLNIYTTDEENTTFPTNASIQNIEIVNINNAEGAADIADASNFDGVEQLWQIAASADVTELEETTTAGFRDITDLSGAVTGSETATSVSVALDGASGTGGTASVTALGDQVGDYEQVGVLTMGGAAVDTINVSGALDLEDADATGLLAVAFNYGEEIEDVTINSDIRLDVYFADNGGTGDFNSEATVKSVDATGATAGVSIGARFEEESTNLVATQSNTTISSITTGDAADLVFVTTETSDADGVNATVSTGAGDDLIGVATTGDGNVTVDAGDGDDLIDLTEATDPLSVGNSFDGGAGDDTLVINAQETYDDATLVLLRDNAANIETLVLDDHQGDSTIDVSKLQSEFDTVAFAGVSGTATVNEVADEKIVSQNGMNLAVTAAGYDFDGSAEEFGGDLDITVNVDDFEGLTPPYVMPVAVEANGSNVTLNVVAENTTEDRSEFSDSAALLGVDRLKGNAETVTVNLSSGVNDNDGTESNNFALVSINAEDDADLMPNLTSVDLTGNGIAFVQNETGSKLATVDASGLDSTLLADYAISEGDFGILFKGDADLVGSIYGTDPLEAGDKGFGLIFDSDNADLVETVTLSDGVDLIALNGASTIDKMDTINGLSLEVDAEGNLTNQSDLLRIEPNLFEPESLPPLEQELLPYEKLTASEIDGISEDADTLELYLTEVAALEKDDVVFDFGGDTYVYNDLGAEGYNETDGLVKLTGGVDIDAALESLNYGYNVMLA